MRRSSPNLAGEQMKHSEDGIEATKGGVGGEGVGGSSSGLGGDEARFLRGGGRGGGASGPNSNKLALLTTGGWYPGALDVGGALDAVGLAAGPVPPMAAIPLGLVAIVMASGCPAASPTTDAACATENVGSIEHGDGFPDVREARVRVRVGVLRRRRGLGLLEVDPTGRLGATAVVGLIYEARGYSKEQHGGVLHGGG